MPRSANTQALSLPKGYPQFLDELKQRIRQAQVKAALSVNSEMVLLYWRIGQGIVQRQEQEGWGKAVVEQLSADLRKEFPGIKGFSPQNIWYMRAFFLAWARDTSNLQQPVGEIEISREEPPESQPSPVIQQIAAQIPWGHNIVLFSKLKEPAHRIWYARKTIEHGWSRNVLAHHIDTGLIEREGKAVSNFPATLPPPQSDLAQQTLKDPFLFDFLTISKEAQERELEQALVTHIRDFLLELGAGFSFVGQQYHLDVGGDDFYIDLLFYHLKLRSYVVIELKDGKFKPEYAGKMNFYLSVVDDQLRQGDDQRSIGIILCRDRNRVVAEYALRDMNKPIGISKYELTRAIPDELKGKLPSVEDLEKELEQKSEGQPGS